MPTIPSSSRRSELEQALNTAVQRNGNRTVLFTHGITQNLGLSVTEFECYSLLLDEGPMTAGQLGQVSGLSSGGVTGLVNRLLRTGFVTRERDPKDGRRVIITAIASQQTQAQLMRLYAPMAAAFDEVMADYTDSQLELLIGFLDRCNAMVDALQKDAGGQSYGG